MTCVEICPTADSKHKLDLHSQSNMSLLKEHEVKLVHYLTATGVDNGLLINFGPSVQVKHKFREYKPKAALI